MDKKEKIKYGLQLWKELAILRNDIIHSALFFNSQKDSKISRATNQRFDGKHIKKFLKKDEHETRKWALTINPLRTTRYEALVALTFFWWLGKNTDVWNSGVPFASASVDCRLKPIFKSEWMNESAFYFLLNNSGDMDFFIAYLCNRLPKIQKQLFLTNSKLLFGKDFDSCYQMILNNRHLFHLDKI